MRMYVHFKTIHTILLHLQAYTHEFHQSTLEFKCLALEDMLEKLRVVITPVE